MSAELCVILWRDIPAQVTATGSGGSARAQLPERFQLAIDAAAMRAGLTGSDAYLDEWRRECRPCGDDLEAEAAAEAGRLDAAFPNEALRRLTRNGGVHAAA